MQSDKVKMEKRATRLATDGVRKGVLSNNSRTGLINENDNGQNQLNFPKIQ